MGTDLYSRRGFVAACTASVVAPQIGWSAVGNPAVLSAARASDGSYLLVGLTTSGDIAFHVPLPARGHAAAAHPHLAEVVAIARRPGRFAKVIDCSTGRVLRALPAPGGRHYYGHGAFSADGTLLFTTENDFATGEGRIGVWDRSLNYQRIDEFPSGGIGPHEILRLPNGDLAVANGGIRTHPDTGRDKLNLDTMRSNLAVFSPNGQLKDVAHVSDAARLNSLRHIASSPDGKVICGFQWQGDPYETPSLVSFYGGNGSLHATQISDSILRRLDGYIGSVCAMTNGRYAASAPRGSQLLTFGDTGEHMQSFAALDVCGLGALPAENSLVTDGTGRVYGLENAALNVIAAHDLAFDNHLVTLDGCI